MGLGLEIHIIELVCLLLDDVERAYLIPKKQATHLTTKDKKSDPAKKPNLPDSEL